MRLSRLLAALAHPPIARDPEVTGLAYDSRRVVPGNLFVAIPGFHVDGARFIRDAVARGAVAVVARQEGARHSVAVPLVPVADPRAALATLAAAWFGHPARQLTTIGVTGTDGKTTTSYLASAVLEGSGASTGLFTTVAHKIGSAWLPNPSRQTTPEALEVQELLRRMVDAGVRYAVLESSSHGLELHKLDHCDVDVAVFTNLSPDHLDFHGTVEAYRDAKSRLFAMLDAGCDKGLPKTAIVNADDAHGAFMAAQTHARVLTYAVNAAADIRPLSLDERAAGTLLAVATPNGVVRADLALPGRFNVYNALAAIGVGLACGIDTEAIGHALTATRGAPGRMHRVEAGQPFGVVVDYAHTGAAFAQVLRSLRPLTRGRLIAVFGCAGERGRERRVGMGEAAARGADYSVLTSEDPRGEEPEAIIAEIARAMTDAGAAEEAAFERIADRRKAIARAFALAAAGDIVLLTGKGHEGSIETAAGKQPWNEARVAAELLGGQP